MSTCTRTAVTATTAAKPIENIARIYDLRHSAFIANTINQPVVGRSAEGMRILPGNPG